MYVIFMTMNNNPTLTVFTPAYNRAHTLGRLYDSLCRQTSKDFKWLIVDDGSSDNTKELVESWMKRGDWVSIEYYWKENGGMHTAHNLAYEHIYTELAVCIDSDDYMPDNAVEIIIRRWRESGCERYAGLIGLDVFDDGSVVGTCFPVGLRECKSYDMARKYGVICDKKYVYRTDVIKKYLPYVSFPGEKYGTVNYIYRIIDNDYYMLCSNDVYCVVEYQPDGLSVNIFNQLKQSPRTRAAECNIQMLHHPYLKERMKRAIQYVACSILLKDSHYIRKSTRKLLTIAVTPLGVIYYWVLKKKNLRLIDLEKIKHPLIESCASDRESTTKDIC